MKYEEMLGMGFYEKSPFAWVNGAKIIIAASFYAVGYYLGYLLYNI